MSWGLSIGVDDIAFATAGNVLELSDLAEHAFEDPQKYRVGLGQSQMSVPGEDEDAVTMGAEAAARVLDRSDSGRIRTVLFATESGVDQSKSAAVYLHRLLGLPSAVRAVELKQACYSGTAALQLAVGIVSRNPSEQVLVVAADVARYELGSPGEPTQGAGAVAFLVCADPAVLEVEPACGMYTAEVDDFWRPNHRTTAVVDGKLSLEAYRAALRGAWADYQEHGGSRLEAIDRICFHQPFTKMALKAHDHLLYEIEGMPSECGDARRRIAGTLALNRRVGNCYAASVYLGLVSLLGLEREYLAGARVGIFSYGSGSVGEFLMSTAFEF